MSSDDRNYDQQFNQRKMHLTDKSPRLSRQKNIIVSHISLSCFSCYKKENNDLKQCGQNCTSFTSCAQGSCENPPCPSDFTYEYDETRNVYGCRKKTERNIFCWYRDGTYDCRYAGDSADCTNCDLENLETNGCYYMPLGSKCTPSGLCSHGSKIENCTCIGTITETESGSYCCQKNHTYVNGGCTLLTNP